MARAGRLRRLAHRGDWRGVPENTIGALLAALAIPGCDGLEFDVRLSADDVPVLLHDPTLERVQGVPAAVDALAAAALARHGVPTLADALRSVLAIRPGAFLDIELKGDDHGATTAGVLRSILGAAPTQAVVSSFEAATLRAMRRHLPGWNLWLNAEDLEPATIEEAVGIGCGGLSVDWRAIRASGIGRARTAGLDLAAWTVRRRPTVDRLERLGMAAVCVEGRALDG